MDLPTDYKYNLDRVLTVLDTLQILQDVPCCDVPVPHAIIKLDIITMIMMRNALLHAKMVKRIIKQIQTLRNEQKIFFRLSTISAKDVNMNWDCECVLTLMKMFVTSARILGDLDEAITRKQTLSIVVLPYVEYGTEYRSFIVDNQYDATRDDQGNSIENPLFGRIAHILAFHFGPTFVFDMADNQTTKKTMLIELNQYDESTDLYLPNDD